MEPRRDFYPLQTPAIPAPFFQAVKGTEVTKTHFATVPIEAAIRAGRPDAGAHLPLVMVADDEALIVQTLISILNSHGLATMPALDGTTALEMARLAPPDLLISDVKMPGRDGFELALEVSKAAPGCDVILFSGEPSSIDKADEYRARGLDFLLMLKPVHPADLLACIFELLGTRGWPVPEKVPSPMANPSDLFFLGRASIGHRKACRR